MRLQIKIHKIGGYGITSGRGKWYAWTYNSESEARLVADRIEAGGARAIEVNVSRAAPIGCSGPGE